MANFIQDLEDRQLWTLPSSKDIKAALRGFHKRPLPTPRRTLSFKIHQPTKHKIRRLIDAHVTATNHIAAIVQALHEEPNTPRDTGAVALVLQVQEKSAGKYRSMTLSSSLEKLFQSTIPKSEFRYLGSFWSGIYRDVAQMLVGWVARLQSMADNEAVLSNEEFYRVWSHLEREYRQSMQTVAALRLSPDDIAKEKDDRLERRSKREARWMLERLYPVKSIQTWLEMVEALRQDEPSELKRSAEFEDAPWYRSSRHQRHVREHHFFRRVAESKVPNTVLGTLHKHELDSLAEELQEMLLYYEQVQQVIRRVYATKRGEVAGALPTIRVVLETFLRGKPASYPLVEPVHIVEEKHPDHSNARIYRVLRSAAAAVNLQAPSYVSATDDLEDAYFEALDWFATQPDRRIEQSRMVFADQESEAVQRLFAAIRAMKPPKVMPLRFNGTALPPGYRIKKEKGSNHVSVVATAKQPRYFALLYLPEEESLVLAVFLHTHDGDNVTKQEQDDYDAHTSDREQRIINNPKTLYYVNFPETQFHPEQHSAMLLRLEYGDEYQMGLIRQVIEERRAAQYQLIHELNAHSAALIPLHKSIPAQSPVNFGRMVCRLNTYAEPTFFFQATVHRPPSTRAPVPTCILGVSVHQEGYSFALFDVSSATMRTGCVFIPPHLDTRQGAKRSDNQIYWIANSIVEIARTEQAYIGIEDARWKKKAGTNATFNRILFGIPMQRIVEVIQYKAAEVGLMEPRLIHGISPFACATCHTVLQEDSSNTLVNKHHLKTLYLQRFAFCPHCQSYVLVHGMSDEVCGHCMRSWSISQRDYVAEQYFACPVCSAPPLPARINTACVVAQHTSIDLCTHWKNLKAFRRRAKSALQK